MRKTIPAITYQNDILYPYYCGIAIYEEEEHVYWIQNQPDVTIPNEVDLTDIKLPPTLVGYPYEETFTYSPCYGFIRKCKINICRQI